MLGHHPPWAKPGYDASPDKIVQDLKSSDLVRQVEAIQVARSTLCVEDPPVTAWVRAGILQPLLEALGRDDCPDFQYRALGVLSNVAFGTREHTIDVADSGAIPNLMSFLTRDSCKGDLGERVMMMLGNFALHEAMGGRNEMTREAVTAILPCLRPQTPVRLLRTFVRTYSNFCSLSDDENTNFELLSPALPHLYDLLDIENEEFLDPDDKGAVFVARDIVVDVCTAIANIMLGSDECIEAVQAVPGLTARLVALLAHETPIVQGAALSALGNMLAGTDDQVDRCLQANCMEHIISLLQSSNSLLAAEAARGAGNILAGTRDQIQQALDKDILTPLRNILADGGPESRKQAVCAVTQLCYSGSPAQRDVLSRRALAPYCTCLAASDWSVVGDVLDGIYELIQAAEREGSVKSLCYMLDEFEVLDHILSLQKNVTDKDHRSKMEIMSVTIRKHARDERYVVYQDEVFTAERLVQDLKSSHQETLARASRAAFSMLKEKHPPLNALLEAGIMTPAVQGLDRTACSDLQRIALWSLLSITDGTHKHRKAVIDSGAIPKLLAYLVNTDRDAQMAACCLGNIARHGLESMEPAMVETALAEFRDFVQLYKTFAAKRQNDSMAKLKYLLKALPFVAELMNIEDRQILEDSCQACTDLMHGSNSQRIEAVQAVAKLTARLVALLAHEDTGVKKAALTAVGTMLAGTNAQVQRCVDAGCLDHFVSLLRSNDPFLMEAAALGTRNILGHSQNLIQRALDKDILTPLKDLLGKDGTECQKLAVYSISNLIYTGSKAQCARAIESGVLQPYCTQLAADQAVGTNVLGGLYHLTNDAVKNDDEKSILTKLDNAGVVDLLQPLQEQNTNNDTSYYATVLSSYIRLQVRGEHVVVENGKVYSLTDIVQELKCQDLTRQTRASNAALTMMKEKKRPRDAMLKAGIVALLVSALDRRDCPKLQYNAAGVLFILAGGTHKHRVAIVNAGAIPKLVGLLLQGGEVAEPAALTLGFIAVRAPMTRDLVLTNKAVPAIIPYLRPDTPQLLLRGCVECYKHLCTAIVSESMFVLVTPALPYIIRLLEVEDTTVLRHACAAINNLVFGVGDTATVRGMPGLAPRLVALLGHAAVEVRVDAVSAVANMLTGSDAEIDQYIEAGCLEHLVSLLQSKEPDIVKEAVRATANLLKHKEFGNHLILQDILTLILNMLEYAEPNSFLQYYVTAALGNFTNGPLQHKMAFIDREAVSKLVAILSYGEAVADSAAVALGNIAGESLEGTELVLSQGVVPALLPHLRTSTPLELLESCVNAYKNMCAHIETTSMMEFVSPALPHISDLLIFDNPDILQSACGALKNLMLGSDENKEAVQSVRGLTDRLVDLMGYHDSEVKMAAVQATVNMLRGTEIQVLRCIDPGCIERISSLFKSKNPSLVLQAVQASSNMLRYKEPIQRALDKGLLTLILKLLASAEPNSLLQYHVVAALHNVVASGTPKFRMAVVNGGAVPLLIPLFAQEPAAAELAALVLGYIAGDGAEAREIVLALEAVPALLGAIGPSTPLKAWISCVLAYGNMRSDADCDLTEILERVSPMLPDVFEFEKSDDEQDQILTERICGALVVLMKDETGIEAVQTAGRVTARLVALLAYEEPRVIRMAVVATLYMLSGTEAQVERCLAANCVTHLTSYMQRRDTPLMQEAADVTLQLLGVTRAERALRQDVLTPLMTILGLNPKRHNRVMRGICNLFCLAGAAQRDHLARAGWLEPLAAWLAAADHSLAGPALDSLDAMLQVSKKDNNLKSFCMKLEEIGVLDRLEQLQKHENEELNKKTRRLMQMCSPKESRPPTTIFTYFLLICFQLTFEIWNKLYIT